MTQSIDDRSTADIQTVRETIWAHEIAIYEARGRGRLDPYLAAVAPGYLAWPPHKSRPMGQATLAQHSLTLQAQPHERLAMHLIDFTLNGPTAIVYYQTHRTVLPDGTPVDERFDIVHVWAEDEGGWRILGGMGRHSAAGADADG